MGFGKPVDSFPTNRSTTCGALQSWHLVGYIVYNCLYTSPLYGATSGVNDCETGRQLSRSPARDRGESGSVEWC